MGRSEIACARCGRSVPLDQLSVWEQYEHHRVFLGAPAYGAGTTGTAARRAVYDRVRKHCAYVTCESCFNRLRKGGNLDDIHNRKVAIFAASVFVVGVLIVVVTPLVLPALMIAFWDY